MKFMMIYYNGKKVRTCFTGLQSCGRWALCTHPPFLGLHTWAMDALHSPLVFRAPRVGDGRSAPPLVLRAPRVGNGRPAPVHGQGGVDQ